MRRELRRPGVNISIEFMPPMLGSTMVAVKAEGVQAWNFSPDSLVKKRRTSVTEMS